MRKYFYIFKAEFMTKMQYVFDFATGYIVFSLMIFIFMNLWNYLYSDPSELINGYSVTQMIWYVVITEIIWMILSGRALCKEICKDVKSGSIAYKVNKPYSYLLFTLSGHLGKVFFNSLFYIILSLIFGMIFIGSIPVNFIEFLIVLLSGFLAVLISSLLIIAIGLISFFIEDAEPYYWLYSKIIIVIGVVFPIEYFPVYMQSFLKLSPIYVVSYGPAKLFVDFSKDTMVNILGMQMIYVVFSYLLCYVIYQKGVKKLNVNGG